MNNIDYQKFTGVFSLLLTPFRSNKEIDWDVYEQYVNWQLSFQPAGLFAVCGSSEMKWLTLEERLELARRAVELAGTTPVVATANLEPNLDDHPEELRRMIETGVSGVVLVPPNGMGEDQHQLYAYMARMADLADCPVILYEWPLVHPYHIEPEIYGELVASHGVLGLKDTTCTLEGIKHKVKVAPDSIVYQANTSYLLESVSLGVKGVMAIVSAASGETVIDFWNAAVRGESEASALHNRLVYLDALLRFSYPASAKYLASLQGVPIGMQCRADSQLTEEAKKAMDVWHGHS
ncbi:4-hydroxy-tetrahydrodipicolinate synthase [compost metagenome]